MSYLKNHFKNVTSEMNKSLSYTDTTGSYTIWKLNKSFVDQSNILYLTPLKH